MNHRIPSLLTLLSVLALALVALAHRPADADEKFYEHFSRVTLTDLQTNPTSFKTAQIRFKAIFHKIESIYSPFYTPFVPEKYMAFSVWDYDKKLWIKGDRLKDFPFIFIKKDNPRLARAATCKKYSLVEIVGTVENDFNNTPWIEATEVIPFAERRLTDKSLHHLVMGYEYLNSGQPALAEHEFYESMKYDLPDDAHLTVLVELTKISFEARRYKEAEDFAHKVLEMDPKNQIGRDIYRAAREEMVREYHQGAPHGIEGPSGTDNAHPVNQPDNRGRRSSQAPAAANPPAVAAGTPAAAPATAADPRLADLRTRLTTLEQQLAAKDRTIAERSASLARAETEVAALRKEKQQVIDEHARYTGEIAEYRERLASMSFENGKLQEEARALDRAADGRDRTAAEMGAEIEALQSRKTELEQSLAGRDEMFAEMERRAREIEACRTELKALLDQRDVLTQDVVARRTEVEGLLSRREGLVKEIEERAGALETRKAELEQAIAGRQGRAQDLEQQLRSLEVRKGELEVLVTRCQGAAQENEEIVKVLESRKQELDGIVSRREELTRELDARAQELARAKSEVEDVLARRSTLQQEIAGSASLIDTRKTEIAALTAQRDALTKEVEERKQALASAALPKEQPKTQAEEDPAKKLAELLAKQDLLVGETSRLRQALAKKEAEVLSLRDELRTRDRKIGELTEMLAAKDRKIGHLESELLDARATIARQSAMLREVMDKISWIEEQLATGMVAVPAVDEEQDPRWKGRRTPNGRRAPEEVR